MNILIVTDSYPPEIRSASKLVYDLRNYLIQLGHNTDVITTEAKYNIDNEEKFIDDSSVSLPVRVRVLDHHYVSYLVRGLSHLLMPLLFIIAFRKKLNRSYDLVIIYSPPLTLGLFGIYLKRYYAKTTVLNVQDLFPQNAVDLGVMKNKYLIKFFRIIERVCYRHNDIVTFHSTSNLELAGRIFPNELAGKSLVMHNWQKFSVGLPRNESYVRRKYGIEQEKKIAIFAGVLGPAQGLENLITLASEIKNSAKDWHFLILGDGAEKTKLIKQAESLNLTNIQFENFVQPEEYQALLAGCQLGTVFLSELNKTPVVPGKILGYMEMKIPVFCVLNKESDAHKLVHEAECGVTTVAGSRPAEIRKVFLDFVSRYDAFNELGDAGYRYARKNFEIRVVVDNLLAEIKNWKAA